MLKQRIKFIIGSHFWLFKFFSFFLDRKFRFVDSETDIVLEGFPRSANTFSYVALKNIAPKLKIAHHLHLPVQIISGVKQKKPVVILIRRPKDAIISLLLRNSKININDAIKHYEVFYKIALKYKDKIIIAEFNNVIKDFNIIIKKINKKSNLKLPKFDNSSENLKRCREIVENMDKEDTRLDDINHYTVALPTPTKKKAKIELLKKYNGFEVNLHYANTLYEKLIQ